MPTPPPTSRLLVPFLLLALLLATAGSARAEELDLTLIVPAIATPPITRDSDGDGLPDLWELRGYTVNGVFVNLPALGANPWHKDLFVWMDYMVTPAASGSVNLGPSQAVIDNIKAVFANAPVTNPDGKTGINIHPILKNPVTYMASLGLPNDDTSVWKDFDTLKNASFTPAYAQSFRYMIWANDYQESGSSGLARNIPATDFLVSLGTFTPTGGTDWEKLGTFIHELGHCLGLHHGGADDTNYKANYLSIMSYTYQFTGLYRNGHYGDAGNDPLNFDYQRVSTPVLDENHLNEALALSGAGDVSTYGVKFWYYSSSSSSCKSYLATPANANVDWNRNGSIQTDVAFDIHCDPDLTTPTEEKITLTAQNNWQNINYNAGGLIGPTLSSSQRTRRLQEPMPDELKHELSQTTYRKMLEADDSSAQ